MLVGLPQIYRRGGEGNTMILPGGYPETPSREAARSRLELLVPSTDDSVS